MNEHDRTDAFTQALYPAGLGLPSEQVPQSTPSRRRRVRQHVNPLQTGFSRIHSDRTAPLFASLPGPLEVEFGCAEAEFLFQKAGLCPNAYYIGLEIRQELVDRVNRRAQRQGFSQVRAILTNLNHDLPALFLPNQLEHIYINFPDPWFKKDQHKRRIVQLTWARQVLSFLKPGGSLFFQSDVFELALEAMSVFEQTEGLKNTRGEWSFLGANPYGVKSLREMRVEEKGLPVWRILYQKDG